MAKHSTHLKRAGVIVPVIGIGLALLWSTEHPASKAIVSACLVLLAIVVIWWPEAITLFPIKSFGLGGLSLEVAETKSATGEESEDDLRLKKVSLAGLGGEWLEARWALEMKLTYLAKHTLPDHLPLVDSRNANRGGDRPFLTVGSLWYDGLLEEHDAETATSLLTLSPADLAFARKSDLDALFSKAQALAKRLRVRVLTQLVTAWFEKHDWTISDRPRDNRVFQHESGVRLEVAVVFGKRDGKLANARLKKLAKSPNPSIVVVPIWPGLARPAAVPSGDGPHVIRFDQLADYTATLVPKQPAGQ